MAIHNTSYDAANTAVRAFLTKVGAIYWGKSFNTNSGNGKHIWADIRDIIFKGRCAYCETEPEKLQMEHVIMFNREEYGLHHPGNVIPVCNLCNRRSFAENGKHLSWEKHLEQICQANKEIETFRERKNKILKHVSIGKYAYPKLSDSEKNAIRVIAESLYANVITETENSLKLYGKIKEAFIVEQHI